MSRALHIFYQDLRIKDNPAFHSACQNDQLIALYIFQEMGNWSMGAASKVWLHHSLSKLKAALHEKGVQLNFDKGDWALKVLAYVKKYDITDVYFDQPIEPSVLDVEKVKKELEKQNVNFHIFRHSVLFSPDEIRTKSGDPYQVFTPFYRACMQSKEPDAPIGAPKVFPRNIHVEGKDLEELKLLPKLNWYQGFFEDFEIGEEGALKMLSRFLSKRVYDYKVDRDFPELEGTSRMSPHLHFGEISPHTIFWKVQDKTEEAYKRQLVWREFAHHLLFHFPKTPKDPLKENYKDFPWHKNNALLKKWQTGNTGIPIVDAGMRQLYTTGWMHNRVRMIVGSFLVKDLLIPWQDGADWFWDTLVDADLANNTLGWQWVAGCGADAAPYFRIFNPYIQGKKFDPHGNYVKKYVPELKSLDEKFIHEPHLADETTLRQAGIILGKTYPKPLVDHQEAKEKALKMYYNWNK